MGNSQSSPLEQCLTAVCGDRSSCVGFPSDPLYQLRWVKPYNLDGDAAVAPVAVVRPQTAADVSSIIRCATASSLKVQAKAGGHSYGNYGLGGPGAKNVVAVDMVNFQKYSMNDQTWQVTLGAGTLLGDLDDKLHASGGRAMAHGVCPGVGLGGHATIGGYGAASRMWGTCLDHVVEVEVVTADAKIQRASETQNPDLFFALRGAGASFGIITEFVMKTHPEPTTVTQYSYSLEAGDSAALAAAYQRWQTVVADANLDRRFASQLIVTPAGIVVESTFFGSEADFRGTGIGDRLTGGSGAVVSATGWLGALGHAAEREALHLSSLPAPFYSKSLGLRREELLSPEAIKRLFDYMAGGKAPTPPGTPLWAVIFDVESGAPADVPANATAFPHRDKVLFYQSYAVEIPAVSSATRTWLTGLHDLILAGAGSPRAGTAYAGYVDPALGSDTGDRYWGANYPTLQRVKAKWDPQDVFHNPQSVRPATAAG